METLRYHVWNQLKSILNSMYLSDWVFKFECFNQTVHHILCNMSSMNCLSPSVSPFFCLSAFVLSPFILLLCIYFSLSLPDPSHAAGVFVCVQEITQTLCSSVLGRRAVTCPSMIKTAPWHSYATCHKFVVKNAASQTFCFLFLYSSNAVFSLVVTDRPMQGVQTGKITHISLLWLHAKVQKAMTSCQCCVSILK